MRLDGPLDDVFLHRSHVRVLRALYRLPEGFAASGRELARRAGVTHPTALKALGLLVDTGLVTGTRSSTGDAYEMNRDHLLVDHIADLFGTEAEIEQELASFLRDRLLALTNKVERATVFGSAVWGESTPTSDIDLAVSCAPTDVGEVEEALEDLSDQVRRRFGNRLAPLINPAKRKPKTGIWKRIEEEGVPLIQLGKAVSR